jgi:colanic acid/amylovoran biosynthesis glycosyltransferase
VRSRSASDAELNDRPKVAYLTSYYPAVSHTFIRREVVALREQGVNVQTFSIHGPYSGGAPAPADVIEARNTRAILDRRRTHIVRDLVHAFVRHPGAVAATMLDAARSVRGLRNRVWQLFYLAEAMILQRWMSAWGATHVHAHFANAPADVARWTKALGNRICGSWSWSFTMHGPTEFYAVEEHALRAKLRDADFVACISDFCRSQLMVFSDPSEWPKFQVVHCGVVPEEFEDSGGSTDGVFTIVCVGRLVPEKGQMILVQAAGRLVDMGIAARIVFVGDGRTRDDLEAKASEYGIEASFVGYVSEDEVPKWLAQADVFCLPSFAEGLPVVLMEAMACGLAVVTTRIAGIQELVEDGVSGFVVPPGRPDLLATALSRLARDRDRARAMGAAGREKVRADFDVRRSAKLLQRAFVTLASTARDDELGSSRSLVVGRDDPGRDADGRAPTGYVANDDGVRADSGTVADGDRPHDDGTDADVDSIADDRRA